MLRNIVRSIGTLGILALIGCAPPNQQASATSTNALSFSQGASYAPTPAVAGNSTVITFTITYTSLVAGTTLSSIPYTVTKDGVPGFANGTIPSITSGGTASANFSDMPSLSGSHTYVVAVDPNNTTGASSAPANTQTTTIYYAPGANG